jgi:thiamine kinase-like enzyme
MTLAVSATAGVSPGFLPVLEHLESNSVQYFGSPLTSVEPTLELTGLYSRVLRVRIDAGGRVTSIFIKRYEPRSGTSEETTRFRRYVDREYARLLLAAGCATEAASVARPIAFLPEHFALITEQAQGVPLQGLFKRLAVLRTPTTRDRVQQALAHVATWVRNFQSAVPPNKPRTRDQRKYIDIRLLELVDLRRPGFGEAERAAVLECFDGQLARLTSADLAPVASHGDLCPSNILVHDNGVTVLDLAMSTDGTRYQDLSHLTLHVELAGRRFFFGSSLVDRLRSGFLQAFEPGLDARTPLFRMSYMQHAVCYLAEIARQERVLGNTVSEWRWRSRVAWCMNAMGVRPATRR